MFQITDLRTGTAVELDGEPFVIVRSAFQKTAQRTGVMKCELRNLLNGRMLQRTFQGADKIPEADVERRTAQFLYRAGDDFTFMDAENFEQFNFTSEKLGDASNFLMDGQNVIALHFHGNPVAIDVPPNVELLVTETAPGVRGDTAQGGSKPATLETGFSVQVPLFVNAGDRVKVDTRTGKYLERVV